MGWRAKEFEDELSKNYDNSTPEEQRQLILNLMKKFGYTMTCCRITFENSRNPYIRDATTDAFVDESGHIPITRDRELYKPAKNVPDFPLLIQEEKQEQKEEEKIQEEILPKNVAKNTTIKKFGVMRR